MEALPARADRFEKVLEDEPAKQLTLQYLRHVPGGKIQSVLREGFVLNADADALRVGKNEVLKESGQFWVLPSREKYYRSVF